MSRPPNGAADKLQEAFKAFRLFELRRQLNSRVGRRCALNDTRRFPRPLNGRKASVQHPLNLHLLLVRNVRLKRMLGIIAILSK